MVTVRDDMIGTTSSSSKPVITSRVEQALVIGMCLLALGVRLPGLTTGDLWADDAWFALVARVPFHEVWHLTLTTPLLSTFLAGWIRLVPMATWWAQLPGLVAGVVAVWVTWLVAREIGVGIFARLAVTLMAACSPGAIEYSMRVKEYPWELLIGSLLLFAAARWRRTGGRRPLLALGVGGVIACFWSGSLVAVVGVLGVVLIVLGRRSKGPLVAGFAMLASCGVATLTFLSHLPPALNAFWSPQEIQHFGTRGATPLHLALIGSGIAHGLVGIPLPVGPFPLVLLLSPTQIHFGEFELAIEALCLLVATLVVARTIRRRREPAATVGVIAVLIIAAAIAGALLGRAPLGGVRTDLWWYPAAWVLSALVIDRVAAALPVTGVAGLAVRTVGVVLAVGIIVVGLLFPAWYPHEDVRRVRAEIGHRIGPQDALIVAGRVPFTWAYEGVGPFHVIDDAGGHRPTNGFDVAVSRPPKVVAWLLASPAQACARFQGVFIFTSDASLASPSAYRIASPAPYRLNGTTTLVVDALVRHGWTTTRTWRTPGVVVLELHHLGRCAS